MPTLLAPAKLTVSLRLTGIRDDGMHLIDAEMVSIDLYDSLELTEPPATGRLPLIGAPDAGGGGASSVSFGGPAAGDMARSADGADLVSGALRLCGRVAAVTVRKHIPAGAGLGGGSSDAAAILRWAGFTDVAAAARLGADVAFCLVGSRARVRGIGEIVEPLAPCARTFTILTPPIHCSTPVVYRTWDEMGGPRSEAREPNDLEAAALRAYPALVPWRGRLGDASGMTPRLAGSGSTWFVEGDFPGDGRQVVRSITEPPAPR